MNLDDETLLSGYLDGELDPEQRARVESALAASPELTATLAELAAACGQVSGLSRPLAPRDLTANVLARVARDPRARLRRAVRVRPQLAWAGLAAAASLAALLAVRPPDWGGGRSAGEAPSRIHAPRAVGDRPVASRETLATEALAESKAVHEAPEPVVAVASGKVADREGERVRALLDRPGVQRLVVMVDAITPEALRTVEDALEATPRIEPLQGRLHVGQGIVLDPSRPGEAVVYMVVLDENELTNLQAQLTRRLKPGQVAVSTEPAEPAIVTQLADVGTIQAQEGRMAAPGLFEPPPLSGTTLAHNPGPPDLTPRERLAAETPGPEVRGDDTPTPKPRAPRSFPRRVTLVWVTARVAGDARAVSNPS